MSFRCFAPLIAIVSIAQAIAGEPAETAFTPVAVPATQEPLTLKIGVNDIYCAKTACECISEIAKRSYDGVLAELKKQNINLEFTYLMEVMDLQKAIKAGDFDGVLCKPWTALQYNTKGGRDFKRVADILDPQDQAMMTGLFVVPKESSIKSLADLQGKRVVFGQPDAYEKYHAPLTMLAEKNIRPASSKYFSSCGENLDAVMSGSADAAVISSYAFTATCAVDFAKPENFRTIAVTDKMPLTSMMLDCRRVSAATASRVQQALLSISGEKTPEDLCGKGFVVPASWQPVARPAPAADQ